MELPRTDPNNEHLPPSFRAMAMTNTAVRHGHNELVERRPTEVPTDIKDGEHDQKSWSTIGWDDNPTLPRMSFYHTLSVIHRLFPRPKLMAILHRLKETFRLLSLVTVFHNSPELTATCQSLDQVELEVQLFECRHDSNQVLLELNRVAGDTIAYHGYTRNILAACFNEGGDHQDCNEMNREAINADLGSVEAFLTSLQVPEPERDTTQETLEIVLDMLQTDRYDARFLGLQSLAFLTDPSKTFPSVATSVAKLVLLGHLVSADGTTHEDPRIQQLILSLVMLGRWPDTPPLDEHRLDLHKPHVHLALIIMANAAGLLKDKTEVTILLERASRIPANGTSLVLTAQKRLLQANVEPHAAYLATRILMAICRRHPDAVRSRIQPDAVRTAHQVGEIRHAALEAASAELLIALLCPAEGAALAAGSSELVS